MIAGFVIKFMRLLGMPVIELSDQLPEKVALVEKHEQTTDGIELAALSAHMQPCKAHIWTFGANAQLDVPIIIPEVTTVVLTPPPLLLDKNSRPNYFIQDLCSEQPRQVAPSNAAYAPQNLANRKPGPKPTWLNRNDFRDAMYKRVNNVINGRWEAVSTPNGIVWFRYNALLDVLREASKRDPNVLGLAADKARMNDLVFTVLQAFKDDCVVWGMMGKGYIGLKCNVINRKGNIAETSYFTPIKATWFNQLPSWLERGKSYKLRQAVAKIEPVHGGIK